MDRVTYIIPELVISPKGRVKVVKVLFDGGESGWALAEVEWDGDLATAIRWNGNLENPSGTPQSRGLPIWFILPEGVDEAAKKIALEMRKAETFVKIKG